MRAHIQGQDEVHKVSFLHKTATADISTYKLDPVVTEGLCPGEGDYWLSILWANTSPPFLPILKKAFFIIPTAKIQLVIIATTDQNPNWNFPVQIAFFIIHRHSPYEVKSRTQLIFLWTQLKSLRTQLKSLRTQLKSLPNQLNSLHSRDHECREFDCRDFETFP